MTQSKIATGISSVATPIGSQVLKHLITIPITTLIVQRHTNLVSQNLFNLDSLRIHTKLTKGMLV